MMAGATKVEEFKISEDEAKKLSTAINNVNSFYDIGLDPKIMAWVGLVTTCVAIYAPRVALYKMRTSFEKDKKAQAKKAAEINTPINFEAMGQM